MSAVRAQVVVEAEKRVELGMGVDQRDVVFKIDLVIFYRAPQALDEHVVQRPAPAVHRDFGRPAFEDAQPLGAGELTALVLCDEGSYVKCGQAARGRSGAVLNINTHPA